MSKKPANFVTQIDTALGQKLKKDLAARDFELSAPPYTLFAAKKKGISCTLYESGKLVVQGKDKDEFIEFYLEPEVLKTFDYTHKETAIINHTHIGIDESGKGDFFGPLCIAGVYADKAGVEKLLELGVQDSKRMNDRAIEKMARQIRDHFDHHSVRINPAKYNELYEKFGNLNHLLAWGHSAAIEALVQSTGCKSVIIDQFANERVVLNAIERKGLQIDLTQRHRGEEDPVVAAASILARDLFVSSLTKLEKEFDCELPKGASAKTKQAAKAFVRRHGAASLPQVAKMHFKTAREIL